ncbi:MAG TPA: lysylphosphatidylglycerol synthase domain-containing protein [candidate division Zixibacteria bacterium]
MDNAHPTPTDRPKQGWRSILRLTLTLVLVGVVAFVIGRSIWSGWDAVVAQDWTVRPLWLSASVIVGWLSFASLVQLWRLLLTAISRRTISYARAYRATALANLGKYVPGKVWSVMGLVYFLREDGFAPAVSLAATILHQAYTVVSGAIFIVAILGTLIVRDLPIVVVIAVLAGCTILLYPPIFSRLVNRGMRLLKRDPIVVAIPFLRAVAFFFGYLAAWTCYGATFWLLLNAIGIEGQPFWSTAAAFVAAYLLGFLALFSPGGLGVREGVLAWLLSPALGAGVAGVLAVITRIWATVLELLQLLPIVFFRRMRP